MKTQFIKILILCFIFLIDCEKKVEEEIFTQPSDSISYVIKTKWGGNTVHNQLQTSTINYYYNKDNLLVKKIESWADRKISIITKIKYDQNHKKSTEITTSSDDWYYYSGQYYYNNNGQLLKEFTNSPSEFGEFPRYHLYFYDSLDRLNMIRIRSQSDPRTVYEKQFFYDAVNVMQCKYEEIYEVTEFMNNEDADRVLALIFKLEYRYDKKTYCSRNIR